MLFFYPKAATPGCTKEVRTAHMHRTQPNWQHGTLLDSGHQTASAAHQALCWVVAAPPTLGAVSCYAVSAPAALHPTACCAPASLPWRVSQACKFRDEYAAFQDVGAQVYGISSDSPAANKAFAESHRLPFPLLTDPAGALRKVGARALQHRHHRHHTTPVLTTSQQQHQCAPHHTQHAPYHTIPLLITPRQHQCSCNSMASAGRRLLQLLPWDA